MVKVTVHMSKTVLTFKNSRKKEGRRRKKEKVKKKGRKAGRKIGRKKILSSYLLFFEYAMFSLPPRRLITTETFWG